MLETIDYKKNRVMNLYNDQAGEVFFNDLSDMNQFHIIFQRKILSKELSYDRLTVNSNILTLCRLMN
jgi:hypothetical protein